MANNRKPRKAHRHRAIILNPIEMALNGSNRVPKAVVDSYINPLRSLCARIKTGSEEVHEWTSIRDAALVCEALMETGAADMPRHVRDGLVGPWLEAVESAVTRRRLGPRDGLTAAEREQLDGLVTWYEALLGEASQRQLLESQRRALRRVRQALAEVNRQVMAAGLPQCRPSPELARIAEFEAGL